MIKAKIELTVRGPHGEYVSTGEVYDLYSALNFIASYDIYQDFERCALDLLLCNVEFNKFDELKAEIERRKNEWVAQRLTR